MASERTFPCLICGAELKRVFDQSPAQPSDGVMCETAGNYGSTVWDSLNGEMLAFNICDPCLTEAGRKGRVWLTRRSRPVTMPGGVFGRSIIGHEYLDREYTPWDPDRYEVTEDVFELSRAEVGLLPDPPLGYGVNVRHPSRLQLNFSAAELLGIDQPQVEDDE